MTTSTSSIHCSNCDEQYDIFQCRGCSTYFCYRHLPDHRDKILQNFAQLQDNCNLLRENLQDFPYNYPLIQQITQWEMESIDKIKQTANKCREKVYQHFVKIKKNLNNIYGESTQISKENKLNEILLNELSEKLNKLKEDFNKPSNISIGQYATSFINQMYIIKPLSKENKWKQNPSIVAGGNDEGNQLNQLDQPYGIVIDENQTIYIADCFNHRIVEWKPNSQQGRIVAGGNGQGVQTNQLSRPTDIILDKENNSLIIADWGNSRIMQWSLENNTTHGQIIIGNIACWGLAMDKDGSLYISDCMKNEVRRWKKGDMNAKIVAGGNGQGDQLNQFNVPTHIFVDDNYSLYVSDFNNHRIMKWVKDAREGIVVAGGNGKANGLKQLSYPTGVTVDKLSQIYVSEWGNHRIVCWCEGDSEGRIIIGEKDQENQSNQLHHLRGLSFDIEGNLYVAESGNNRILKYEVD